MKELFYKRGKGRITRSLAVYKCDGGYKLHYLVFDRTKITKEQRLKGEKEKRFKTLDKELFFISINEIQKNINELPLPELTIEFLKGGNYE